jgi:hypothetical protein
MQNIIKNQIDNLKKYICEEEMKIVDLLPEDKKQEAIEKIFQRIKRRQNNIDKRMNEGIDIGGIMSCVVKPFDIVKIDYDNSTSCFAFAVKEGRKTKYYYAENHI